MKIKPIILCGGSGTRLWPESNNNIPKQFIDFGGWTLFKKTLDRIKNPQFDTPIISTNLKYLGITKKFLLKYKIKKFTIILEPCKKNTAAAILSSTLLNEIKFNQPIVFLPSDHLIEKTNIFINQIKKNKKLNEFLITDLLKIAYKNKIKSKLIKTYKNKISFGINTFDELRKINNDNL